MKHMSVSALLAAFACVIAGSATARTLGAPSITNFAPKSGAIGSKVTVVGTNLTGASVTFNGARASGVTVNKWGNALVATVPEDSDALPVGAMVQIVVTTPGGSAMSAASFLVTQTTSLPAIATRKPLVSSLSPSAAKAGATVTLTGSHFGGALAVRFGGVKATFSVPSASKILATVPAHAKTGRISVQTRTGVGMSSGRFTVIPSAQT